MGLLRKLMFHIAGALYTLIPDLYDIFYKLASAKFLSEDDISKISRNIYIIVSVCMLFALGIRLLNAIVNPASFNDDKKGARRTFINCVIAVFLIALVPIGFEQAYEVQNSLIEDNLIAKVILGKEVGDNKNIGKIIAVESFKVFCEPDEDYAAEKTKKAFNKLQENFNDSNMDSVGDRIREKESGEWEIRFHMLLSPLFGGYMVYQMILLCLDIALRTVKLAILQILSPLVICGFIFSGTELLQRWFKEVASTYIIIFAKLIAVLFMVLGFSIMKDFLDAPNFSGLNLIAKGFVKAAVVIALLTLVKQLPNIINTIFGTKIGNEEGGIRGRLGGMAAIGGIAQRAWDSFRQHPVQSLMKPVTAPVSAVGGYIAHRQAVRQKANEIKDRIYQNARPEAYKRAYENLIAAGKTDKEARETAEKIAHAEATARSNRAARAALEFGMAGGLGAAVRGARSGWQNSNLRGIGAQRQRYLDRHPTESTFAGRVLDRGRSALGLDSSAEAHMRKWDQDNSNLYYIDPDTETLTYIGTQEEVNRRKQELIENTRNNKQKISAIDSRISANQDNVISQAKYIKDRCDEKNLEKDSQVEITAGVGGIIEYKDTNGNVKTINIGSQKRNLASYQNFIDTFNESGKPKKENYVVNGVLDEDAYNAAIADHTSALDALQRDFKNKMENEARQIYIKDYGLGGKDDSIKNAIDVINVFMAKEDGTVIELDDDHIDNVYKNIDSYDKKKKGENSKHNAEKNTITTEMSSETTELQRIEQAETEHKRAREQEETTARQIEREANRRALDAARGQNNNNNNNNNNGGNH